MRVAQSLYSSLSISKPDHFVILLLIKRVLGFPGGAGVKNLPANAGDARVPWRRKWQPTPAFLPGKFHGQSIGAAKSWTRLSTCTRTHTHTHRFWVLQWMVLNPAMAHIRGVHTHTHRFQVLQWMVLNPAKAHIKGTHTHMHTHRFWVLQWRC